jgi:hypothetical protein
MSDSLEPPRTLRAAASTYAVPGVMGAVIIAMMMPSRLSSAKESDWILPISSAAILVVFLLFARVYKIEISDDSVSYRPPLRGTRTIRYADIDRVQTSIRINASAVPAENRSGPMFRLEIYPRANSHLSGRIVVNIQIFRFQDIRLLIEVLKKKVPNSNFE